MNSKRILIGALIAVMLTLGAVVYAKVTRPYHNGSVWNISFIRIKPGMDAAYKDYLAKEWKESQEAAVKEKLILSYKVITTEAHSATDWNIMLMTEYKDLATYEANQPKQDALAQTTVGTDDEQREGYRKRLEIREVLGTRLSREVVLAPR